jgi:hypothetical protein
MIADNDSMLLVAIALAKGAMPTSELEVCHDDEVGKSKHKWELRSI